MMSKHLKVEGHAGLVRDPNSGAILNINTSEVDRRIEQKQRLKRLDRDKQQELKDLRKDVNEIKQLLHKLAENLND